MKKIIFCFDGTCNDPSDSGDFFTDSSISNVLKIYALFGGKLPSAAENTSTTNDQHCLYYSGVGTRGNWLRQTWNSMFAPPGADMRDILDEAKEDLKKLYQDGDQIFIFGFSRGAAIARMFAAKHADNRPIKFLGLFDTVAATEGSLDLKTGTLPASGIVFENGTIGNHIEKALHLLSIDEKRIAFQPTLFNKDKRVTEIWFAGAHSDIGGGYWFDGLSDITLQFMLDEAENAGLKAIPADHIDYAALADKTDEDENICLDDIAILPISNGTIHEQHRSGLAAKTLAPRLIRVNKNDLPDPNDHPLIHYTVAERFKKVPDYRPFALRNRTFRIINQIGEQSPLLRGIEGLREYE
ncbi:MAG: hypothetical protein CSA60_03880 [Neptuniibacter caesariensis]|uniref:T6SS Phospholipase effector Tle1-like catalytic domain-containing protein n=1 Tax=Neptuniibacter caesariensis TaxID=207954 RepID=A0A2G6JKS3_NEPCE|nr:MAG: hypothetical protein CSA60_03880 [Neptuniibacter caesariensis]